MLSPLPRNKRAKNPNLTGTEIQGNGDQGEDRREVESGQTAPVEVQKPAPIIAPKPPPAAFQNSPFAKLDLNPREETK